MHTQAKLSNTWVRSKQKINRTKCQPKLISEDNKGHSRNELNVRGFEDCKKMTFKSSKRLKIDIIRVEFLPAVRRFEPLTAVWDYAKGSYDVNHIF